MSASSLIVALDSQKKGRKEALVLGKSGWISRLSQQQGIIESRAICAAPFKSLSRGSYQYYAPCADYDSTEFFDHCNTIQPQRSVYENIIRGEKADRIYHMYNEQYINFKRSRDIRPLSKIDTTQEIFEYYGSFEDAVKPDSAASLGFPSYFTTVHYKEPADRGYHRVLPDGSMEINERSLYAHRVDIARSLDMTIPEPHTCDLPEKALVWYRPISDKVVSHLNSELSLSPSIRNFEYQRNASNYASFNTHVNLEVLKAVQRCGRRMTRGEISVDRTPDPPSTSFYGTADIDDFEIHTIPGISFTIRNRDGDPVEINLSWLSARPFQETANITQDRPDEQNFSSSPLPVGSCRPILERSHTMHSDTLDSSSLIC
ncbi:hypothetical protein V865_007119 [Kwoniella europaea PYCC6329]|uniref:Uncharacterized protein n=1 Tax=Kwoniella europaea PYCC6329 TaxID=1423913 RepID=A0AAX4KS37_9TREE